MCVILCDFGALANSLLILISHLQLDHALSSINL